MCESFQVKGSALSTKLAFLRSQAGKAMAAEAEEFLAAHGIATVLESIWYPYSTYDALLRWVADRCFGSDLKRLEEVGRFSAEAAHTSTYKGFVGSGDFQRYLEQLSVLHGRLYSLGSVLVSPGGDSRSCTVRIVETPGFSEPAMHIVRGFYSGAALLHGLEGIRCDATLETDGATFELRW
jgi:hypothetical protein